MKICAVAVAAFFTLISCPPANAAGAFAPGFTETTVQAGGRSIHYRVGGTGPVVLLLHGYGDTGDMWAPLAPRLARTHRVIVPDLPGLGKSRPESPNASYDMAPVARSIHALMTQLKVQEAAVVGHDIGLMVAYAYAAQYPTEVTKLIVMDAPIPGVGPWQEVLLNGATWHFHFNGKYAEQLTAGRERIYLNRIWDDFAFHPERIPESERRTTAASYAQPGNMHAGFSYFAGFYRDADANVKFARTPLPMPVLAIGGDHSFGALMPQFAKAVATDVKAIVISDSGHWVMDENPKQTMAAIMYFLAPARR